MDKVLSMLGRSNKVWNRPIFARGKEKTYGIFLYWSSFI